MRLSFLLIPFAVTALMACSDTDKTAATPAAAKPTQSHSAPAPDMTAQFQQLLSDSYQQDMVRAPYTASYRGQPTDNGKWNSVSEAHQQESQAIRMQRLKALEAFAPEALPENLQLSLQLFRSDLERRIASDAFRHHKYVIHQYRGPHTQAASNLINVHTVEDIPDAEDYISRIADTGRWFDEVIEQLKIRERKRMFLADWAYPQMIQAARNVISGAPFDDGEDSTIWADFKSKLEPLDLPADFQQDLESRARTALLEQLRPAYERLIAELQHQAPLAPAHDGVWKFPDGDAFYAERLRWFTTTDLSADEVHKIGLREVARIHGEMRAIMAAVNFDGDLAEFFEFMRSDEQFYYPNTDAGREAYMAEATRMIDVMRTRLPEQFGIFPKSPMIVKRVEAFREQSAGKAFYQRPLADGSRPGIYYANLFDMSQMPKYQMEALAYHEGIPGHHMQLAISVELEDVPEFQKHTTFTAFTEGWGLYSEFLPKEMGFYEDPYSDFGRLAMELWRAARLVVDTGIHSKQWTREEAIAYLTENTPNPAGDARKAIERYIAMPGQATAYMIGKLKIIELRENAREALGDDFDIRAFHDELLKDGPVPLSILEQKIDRLVERGGR